MPRIVKGIQMGVIELESELGGGGDCWYNVHFSISINLPPPRKLIQRNVHEDIEISRGEWEWVAACEDECQEEKTDGTHSEYTGDFNGSIDREHTLYS